MSSASDALSTSAIEFLARGLHADPFAVLGPHEAEHDGERGLTIRAFRPHAASIAVHALPDDRVIRMTRLHSDGVFEAFVPQATRDGFDYRLRIVWTDSSVAEMDDPYRYGPVLTEFDQHLFAEGTHVRAFD
ncbi:MAG: GlgB N-terminal domain-containing protein, partial [Vicinamibacterales bacterium]